MSDTGSERKQAMRDAPKDVIGPVWVEWNDSLTVHLSRDEAERLIHALPFDYPLAKVIREALRTGGPMSPIF